jgi:hypothetical protein
MKHISVLKNARSALLAGMVVFGVAGVVHAQIPGPGQVGGMGQGGAPAGEFPSDRGNVPPTQRNMQGGASPGQDIPEKDPSRDSSQEQRPGSTKRDSGAGSSISKEPGAAKGPKKSGASNSSSTSKDSSTPGTPPSGTGGY